MIIQSQDIESVKEMAHWGRTVDEIVSKFSEYWEDEDKQYSEKMKSFFRQEVIETFDIVQKEKQPCHNCGADMNFLTNNVGNLCYDCD